MYYISINISNMGKNIMTIGNNTAYEIVVYLAGNPQDSYQQLIAYIMAAILIVIFFISIIYIMKVITTGIISLGR